MKKFIFLICPLLIVLIQPCNVFAEKAVIEDLRVTHGASVDVAFTVNGALTEEIMQAINSGIPTSFTYIVKLYRSRTFLPDKHIKTYRFNHTVKYDNLQKTYNLILNRRAFGYSNIELKVADVEEMKALMVNVDKVSFIPEEAFMSGYTYRLAVKAELDVVKLPLALVLDYVLFFVKLWDFETDWYEYRFTY